MARNRFTIYDRMEHDGVFEKNPANSQAKDQDGHSLYQGPVEYPKMFYHPEGKTKVTVPAEVVSTPEGPARRGEQREILWRLATGPGDEKALREAGWHDHPAKAMAAAGLEAPPMGAGERIRELEAQLAEAQRSARVARGEEDDGTGVPQQVGQSGALKPHNSRQVGQSSPAR